MPDFDGTIEFSYDCSNMPSVSSTTYGRVVLDPEKLFETFKFRKTITMFEPTRIIFNGPATIVFWDDGTKTVVKRSKKDKDNKYNAVCAAIAIKLYGNNSKVSKFVNMGVEEK